MSTKPIIRVVQYHWGDQNHSYRLNCRINGMYCLQHGYEYIVKTFVPRDDRACRWSKIPAMREELHDCDFLLYLDADAFFFCHKLRIEELLQFLGEKQIMMRAGKTADSRRQTAAEYILTPDSCLLTPDTGVVLVRNTPQAAEMLRVWDESSEQPGLENLRFHSSGERAACFQTMCREYADDVKLLNDYDLISSIRGMFIRHLAGMKDDERYRIQNSFLEDRLESMLLYRAGA